MTRPRVAWPPPRTRCWSVLAVAGVDGRLRVMAQQPGAGPRRTRCATSSRSTKADEAVRLSAELPALQALLIQTRAWIAVRAGQLLEGLREFHRSAEAYAGAGMPLGEYYTEYADAMVDLRLLPEASSAAEHAVDSVRVRRGCRCSRPRPGCASRDIAWPAARAWRARSRTRSADEAGRQRRGARGTMPSSSGSRLVAAPASAWRSASRVARRAAGSSIRRATCTMRSRRTWWQAGWRWRRSTGPRRGAAFRRGSGWLRPGAMLVRLRGRSPARSSLDLRAERAGTRRVPDRAAGPRGSTVRAFRRSSCVRWRPGTAPSWARSGWAWSWTAVDRPGRSRGWSAPARQRCWRGSRRSEVPLTRRGRTEGRGREGRRPHRASGPGREHDVRAAGRRADHRRRCRAPLTGR